MPWRLRQARRGGRISARRRKLPERAGKAGARQASGRAAWVRIMPRPSDAGYQRLRRRARDGRDECPESQLADAALQRRGVRARFAKGHTERRARILVHAVGGSAISGRCRHGGTDRLSPDRTSGRKADAALEEGAALLPSDRDRRDASGAGDRRTLPERAAGGHGAAASLRSLYRDARLFRMSQLKLAGLCRLHARSRHRGRL